MVEPASCWPTENLIVNYAGRQILLRAATERTAPSIAMDIGVSGKIAEERIFLRRFLSALSWATEQAIRDPGPAIGGANLGSFSKGPGEPQKSNARFLLPDLPSTADAKVRLALALHREALGINNATYQFLSFYKIINVLFKDCRRQIEWINASISSLTHERAVWRLNELKTEHANLGKYLYETGRCAIAHAYQDPLVDPDNPDDTYRLVADLPLIKALAVMLIEKELGVKTTRTLRREKLQQLAGFEILFGPQICAKLRKGEELSLSEIAEIPNLDVQIPGAEEYESLKNLAASIGSVHLGSVRIHCVTPDKLLMVDICLNFPEGQLQLGGGALDERSSLARTYGADFRRFQCELNQLREFQVRCAVTKRVLAVSDPYLNLG